MGRMEWCSLDSRKKEHEAIIAAISELGRIGYLISSACFNRGALEIICYPPDKADNAKMLQEAIESGYGLDEGEHVFDFKDILKPSGFQVYQADKLETSGRDEYILKIGRKVS